MEYAKKNFPGHQALVCTHMDGHNGSGNIHVHIVINSLRKYDVGREGFMERPCDSRAGFKHHLTKKYLAFLKRSVMDMCQRENLHQADLLSSARDKVTDREYYAGRRRLEKSGNGTVQENAEGRTAQGDTAGQRSAGTTDMQNRGRPEKEKGTPQQAKFQTQKQYLRDAIKDAAAAAQGMDSFKKILSEKYGVTLKESRGRFSYIHPERTKPITGRALGADFDTDAVRRMVAGKTENRKEEKENRRHAIPAGMGAYPILYANSSLQDCTKAQQSVAYAQKVKLSNLKQMAQTVAYVQEYGYGTRKSLEATLCEAKAQTASSRKALKDTEGRLRDVNEQIHFTGQYLANKSVHAQLGRAKNKWKFRQEHSAEISLYEAALKFLKEKLGKAAQGGNAAYRLPSMKMLKEEKENLLELKKEQQEQYHICRDRQKELHTACSNVDAILRQPQQGQMARQKHYGLY